MYRGRMECSVTCSSILGRVYLLVPPTPLPQSIGIIDLATKREIIYWNQQLTGKILSRKDLADYWGRKSFGISRSSAGLAVEIVRFRLKLCRIGLEVHYLVAILFLKS